MRTRAVVPVALLVLVALNVVPVPSAADHVCDPYPIGRCGDFQREVVSFCWVTVGGQMVSATATNVVSTPGHPPTGVPALDKELIHVHLTPAEDFVDDPNGAPAPFKTLWQESNNVAGLQMTTFKCGQFTWFAECEPMQWMGPTGTLNKLPDLRIV